MHVFNFPLLQVGVKVLVSVALALAVSGAVGDVRCVGGGVLSVSKVCDLPDPWCFSFFFFLHYYC